MQEKVTSIVCSNSIFQRGWIWKYIHACVYKWIKNHLSALNTWSAKNILKCRLHCARFSYREFQTAEFWHVFISWARSTARPPKSDITDGIKKVPKISSKKPFICFRSSIYEKTETKSIIDFVQMVLVRDPKFFHFLWTSAYGQHLPDLGSLFGFYLLVW